MWASLLNLFKAAPKSAWGAALQLLGLVPELYRQWLAWKETTRKNERIDLVVQRDKLQEQLDKAIVARNADEISRLHIELNAIERKLFKL